MGRRFTNARRASLAACHLKVLLLDRPEMESDLNLTLPSTNLEGSVKPDRHAVAYFRVSTSKQGESGLGLEAQRAAVAAFIKRQRYALLAEYTEVETAKRDDLTNRPELRRAVAHARRSKAILLVAKLDRLVRSVHVTSLLHQSGVEFVAADNPNANRLTIQILAAVAEHEAQMISDRTRAALAAYKARGGRLGSHMPQCRNLNASAQRKGTRMAVIANQTRADAAYADILSDLHGLRQSGMSLQRIADRLNRGGHTTRRGKAWNPMQVSRVLTRSKVA